MQEGGLGRESAVPPNGAMPVRRLALSESEFIRGGGLPDRCSLEMDASPSPLGLATLAVGTRSAQVTPGSPEDLAVDARSEQVIPGSPED